MLAAEHRRKKPREIPRPDHMKQGGEPPPGRDDEGRPVPHSGNGHPQQSVAPAIAALKASRKSVRVH